jgi:hypothetical protein
MADNKACGQKASDSNQAKNQQHKDQAWTFISRRPNVGINAGCYNCGEKRGNQCRCQHGAARKSLMSRNSKTANENSDGDRNQDRDEKD